MERTKRPSELLRPELDQPQEEQVEQQFVQRQLTAEECPYCGATNDAEAAFCASCGKPLHTMTCPFCGAEIDPDADYCEMCHRYIRTEVCSFCGHRLNGNEAYCPECGSPKGGLVCPVCRTLNNFAFCKQCGTPLTQDAKNMMSELQDSPVYQELMDTVAEYTALDEMVPYNSERDVVREQMNEQLRERVLTLLAKDKGEANPVIPVVHTKRLTKEELAEKKSEKIKNLSIILDKLALPESPSPVQARNYAMASKPTGIRLAWVCNYKHAMHSSPCGCAKPQLGGKWVVLGKNSSPEIKDDNK